MRVTRGLPVAALVALGAIVVACATRGPSGPSGLDAIEHIVVIYAENRSFDHL